MPLLINNNNKNNNNNNNNNNNKLNNNISVFLNGTFQTLSEPYMIENVKTKQGLK